MNIFENTKDMVIFAGSAASAITITLCSIFLLTHIDDAIKYHRYQEAVKEYQQCAQKYQDQYSVMVYCGDSPPSTIMF